MAKKAAKKTARKPASAKGAIQVPLHSVVHFVQMIQEKGHMDQFVQAAKKSKSVVTMDSASVDFVRNYLTKNQLHGAMVEKVVDPCPGDPFGCHFR
jgi:hypothetical protein